MTTLFGVTGATGGVGGRVAAGLADLGVAQRLLVRDPVRAPRLAQAEVARIPGYEDAEAMRGALRGVDVLLFVSAGEAFDRVGLHRNVIDAALGAGVERVVYMSFLGVAPDSTFTFARDHFHTEDYIRNTRLAFTFLRDSIYLDFVPRFCSPDGVIQGPAGTGRFAPVARDDIAAVAVRALTEAGHEGHTYDVTGRQAIGMQEAADELARATGRPIAYREETLEEARQSRAASGAPDWEIEGWVTTYAAVATGELDIVGETVKRLTGREPQTLTEYLEKHPESYAHIRGV